MQRTPCRRAKTEVGISWVFQGSLLRRYPGRAVVTEVGPSQYGLWVFHAESALAEYLKLKSGQVEEGRIPELDTKRSPWQD